LILNFKARINPKIRETIIIIDAKEKTKQTSKNKKRQRKTKHVKKKKGKIVKTDKNSQKLT